MPRATARHSQSRCLSAASPNAGSCCSTRPPHRTSYSSTTTCGWSLRHWAACTPRSASSTAVRRRRCAGPFLRGRRTAAPAGVLRGVGRSGRPGDDHPRQPRVLARHDQRAAATRTTWNGSWVSSRASGAPTRSPGPAVACSTTAPRSSTAATSTSGLPPRRPRRRRRLRAVAVHGPSTRVQSTPHSGHRVVRVSSTPWAARPSEPAFSALPSQ